MYSLQIQTPNGWVTLADVDDLDTAVAACNRAVMSEKCASRVVDVCESIRRRNEQLAAQLAVCYERFYNRRDDPDENWRKDFDDEDEYGFDWREVGF